MSDQRQQITPARPSAVSSLRQPRHLPKTVVHHLPQHRQHSHAEDTSAPSTWSGGRTRARMRRGARRGDQSRNTVTAGCQRRHQQRVELITNTLPLRWARRRGPLPPGARAVATPAHGDGLHGRLTRAVLRMLALLLRAHWHAVLNGSPVPKGITVANAGVLAAPQRGSRLHNHTDGRRPRS